MKHREFILVFVTIVGAFLNVAIHAQTIYGYAGGGAFNNAPALSVAVPNPSSIATASDGTVYYSAGNTVYHFNPSSGKVTTVAGNGTSGYSGDGAAAIDAQLFSPSSLALDATGNLFIADLNNRVVRRVDAQSGLISTVAGNGTYGFSGDGGAATGAQLSEPAGLAVDAAGNLLIADVNNGVVRRVDAASGFISTIAGNGTLGYSGDGGAATNAQLNQPWGLALDAAGNLFIADASNNVIRRVDGSSSRISTVAGNGAYGYAGDRGLAINAKLRSPTSVAVDAAGNLFITDPGAIRRVDSANGFINLVAGNEIPGYGGDGNSAIGAQLNSPSGVAVDIAGNFFIADYNNNVIRRVDSTSGFISTVVGNGTFGGYSGDGGAAISAELSSPFGVAVDAAGNLFIADTINSVVRRVDATSRLISTVAGNGSIGYSGDGDAATSAQLVDPFGVAVDATGNLFISDVVSNVIRRVDASSGVISTIAGNGTGGYSRDGGVATNAQLASPYSIAVDAAGNLFIADEGNNVVRRVDASSGLISTVAGNGTGGYSGDGGAATNAQLSEAFGLALDATGNLYIADANNNVIRRVDAASGYISTVAGNGTGGYSGDGGAATSAQLFAPAGLAVDATGDLFIADSVYSVIRRVDAASGLISTLAGNGNYGFSGDGGAATSAELAMPVALVLDGNARVYVSDRNNNRIRLILLTDTSPPTITPSIVGVLGSNGWYTSNVTVSWTVSDPVLPVISKTGCGTAAIGGDTSGQLLTCSAVGSGGSTSRSVTIKRDVTLPTVNISNPTPGATYLAGSIVNALYACSDTTSGVATCVGSTSSGAPVYTQTPGNYSLVVNATDAAGNAANQIVNYSVAAASKLFTLTPNLAAFGNQALGTVNSIAVMLKNTGDGTLPIMSIALGGGNVGQFSESNNCPNSLPTGGSCTITVTFKPTSAGAKASIVSVTAGTVTQRMAVSGTGADATYSVAPSSLTFGDQADGVPSAPRSVIVTNTGTVGLPLNSMSLLGANASQFSQTNNCPPTLSVGGACNIQVTFSPTSSGSKTASLKVSGKGGASPLSVALNGAGAIPTYTLSPTSLVFGSVPRNATSSPLPVTLTNTGTLPVPLAGITLTGAFAQTNNCGTSVAVGATCTISMTFSPITKGRNAGTLKVTSSKGAAVAKVGLSGAGT